jgi:hypothetical protein
MTKSELHKSIRIIDLDLLKEIFKSQHNQEMIILENNRGTITIRDNKCKLNKNHRLVNKGVAQIN